jgi:hypothetical protein
VANEFAVQVLITLVIWMYRHSSITQHGLRTSCCHNDLFVCRYSLIMFQKVD